MLVHGVRYVSELGHFDAIKLSLPKHEHLGEIIQQKLRYLPTVTREPFVQQGRVTHLLGAGTVERELGLPAIDPLHDRVMICGDPSVLVDLAEILQRRGFDEGSTQRQGSYVIERAFVEK